MKKATYFLQATVMMTMFLVSIGAKAQTQKSGVYLTYADFQKDSLSYGVDCGKEKHRIRLEDFFNRKFITVIHRGKKVRVQKSVIYGVLYCDGSLQRFSGKQHYRLEEQGNVWIFSQEFTVSQGRGGIQRGKRFFFSNTGGGAIQPLTLLNLKNAFPARHDLHDELSVWFKNDAELSVYDGYHKAYKINRFLEKFIQ